MDTVTRFSFFLHDLLRWMGRKHVDFCRKKRWKKQDWSISAARKRRFVMIRKIRAMLLVLGSCSMVVGCAQPAYVNVPAEQVKVVATKLQTTTDQQHPSNPPNPAGATAGTAGSPPNQEQSAASANTPAPTASEERVTLMAVGDIMVHQEQLEAAWDSSQKVYRFQPFFHKVMPLFQEADWVIGNLETTLSGRDARYTGYPQFNTPESLAADLKQVGFTAVTTANNHSLDRRETGVLRTISYLDQAGLLHTGTFRSAEERNRPLFLEKNGIKLALLAYTYGTNGIPIPKGKPYLVNLIQPDLIKRDIAAARSLGADMVAVALHFGAEYQRMPNEQQKKIADLCLSFGADLILGAHPHVVQPYEWRTVTLADGRKRSGFVAYSLGNFISAQRRDYKDVGAILKLTILKQATGETILEQVELIPTYVHYFRKSGKRHYVIYPLPPTMEASTAAKDPALNKELYHYMNKLYQEITRHVTSLTAQK
jgi:poly-gamma-glutamate synthesis protein (capsule biosynthesis protein)